jgi:mannose-1-phosphate guanylyltransferase
MVLAAGLGTRLRPLTDRCAKPLVPVGDHPALDHVLDRLRAAGATRLVVNAHHALEPMRAFAAARPDVSLSIEDQLLGTAGGIARAASLLGGGDVLVWNGDILADIDVGALVASRGGEATLVVQPLARGEGSVGVDAEGHVVRLRREKFGVEARGGEFLGVHVLGAALRTVLPEQGGLIEDLYVPALARGAKISAVWHEGPWHDIGTIERYVEANVAWLEERGLSSWTGPGARVDAGIALDRSVVGEGARVSGRGTLAGCVVWPGASAEAPLEGVVVTS